MVRAEEVSLGVPSDVRDGVRAFLTEHRGSSRSACTRSLTYAKADQVHTARSTSRPDTWPREPPFVSVEPQGSDHRPPPGDRGRRGDLEAQAEGAARHRPDRRRSLSVDRLLRVRALQLDPEPAAYLVDLLLFLDRPGDVEATGLTAKGSLGIKARWTSLARRVRPYRRASPMISGAP